MIFIQLLFSTVSSIIPPDGQYIISTKCGLYMCCLVPNFNYPTPYGYYLGKGSCGDPFSRWVKTTDAQGGVTLRNKLDSNKVIGYKVGDMRVVASNPSSLMYSKLRLTESGEFIKMQFKQLPSFFFNSFEYSPFILLLIGPYSQTQSSKFRFIKVDW